MSTDVEASVKVAVADEEGGDLVLTVFEDGRSASVLLSRGEAEVLAETITRRSRSC